MVQYGKYLGYKPIFPPIYDWHNMSGYGNYMWELRRKENNFYLVKRDMNTEDLQILDIVSFTNPALALMMSSGSWQFTSSDNKSIIHHFIRYYYGARSEFMHIDQGTGATGDMIPYQSSFSDKPYFNTDTTLYSIEAYQIGGIGDYYAISRYNIDTGVYQGRTSCRDFTWWDMYSWITYALCGGIFYYVLHGFPIGGSEFGSCNPTHYGIDGNNWKYLWGGNYEGTRLWGQYGDGTYRYWTPGVGLSSPKTLDEHL